MAKYPGPGATSSTLLLDGICSVMRWANALKSSSDFLVRDAYHFATEPSIPKPLYGFVVDNADMRFPFCGDHRPPSEGTKVSFGERRLGIGECTFPAVEKPW